MKIDGHCHCCEITFEAEVDPTALTICHCTDCQTITGWAFRANITAQVKHFVLKSGTPKTYVKTAESGNKRRQAFCGVLRHRRGTTRRAYIKGFICLCEFQFRWGRDRRRWGPHLDAHFRRFIRVLDQF